MPKVSGSIVLYFENLEFGDEDGLSLKDQAYDALKSEVFSSDGDVVDVIIDEITE